MKYGHYVLGQERRDSAFKWVVFLSGHGSLHIRKIVQLYIIACFYNIIFIEYPLKITLSRVGTVQQLVQPYQSWFFLTFTSKFLKIQFIFALLTSNFLVIQFTLIFTLFIAYNSIQGFKISFYCWIHF